jgi:hypothetical protein
MKGIPSDEEDEEEDDEKKGSTPKPAAPAAAAATAASGSSDEEDDDEEDEDNKPKGVSHLIEIENPNHIVKKTKKVTELDGGPATLSRREREELEKQQAKERYEKMHLAGKTDEARADLARLALIRKQREDAAKKRDEERKAQEDAKAAAEKRLLDKKAKSGGDAK